jgi:malonate-semialdehyde dehydrogenase (acetylating)/methylmalonate-semialdehyde dehydrogenase
MTTTILTEKLASNYVGGEWLPSESADSFEITNPATSEPLATFALAGTQDVAKAVASAKAAFPAWRRAPPEDRIQYLFAFKQLLEAHFSDIARTTTLENGKTLSESKAELRRGIENVEVA